MVIFMIKVFKGFNINVGTKADLKVLRDILAESDSDVAQSVVDAIDEKVTFDTDTADA